MLRILLRVILVVLLIIALAVATLYALTERRMNRRYDVRVTAIAIPTDAEAIEHGRHLAHRVSICVQCHGPDLGGHELPEGELPDGRLAASNLTRGRGGIGTAYTDEDWTRALLHAVGPDRRALIFMPSHDYHFTARDLGALIAYLKSLPPVDRELPAPRIGLLTRLLSYVGGFPLVPAELIDHDAPRLADAPALDSLVARGQQLVGLGGCRGCHADDFTGGLGPPPGGANITPAAIGDWAEADFIRAIRERVRPDGTPVNPVMPELYGEMSDEELRAIWAFLRSVPPRTR